MSIELIIGVAIGYIPCASQNLSDHMTRLNENTIYQMLITLVCPIA